MFKNVIRIILICLWTITSHQLLAQQSYEEFMLSGKVVDKENPEALPGVHILNANKRQGTVSDIDGNFYIKASENDTLIFSYVGYNQHFLILGDSIKDELKNPLIIHLSKSLVELETVKVFAYKNERDFKNAILELELPEETPVKTQIPGYYYGPQKPVKPGVGSPISFLANKFGKKAKRERQFNEAKKRDEYKRYLHSKYNKEIVSNITGLKDEELDDFMQHCTLSDKFIDDANEYEIIVAINKCYKDFTNRN
ncbi:carboxypeptidase-like regulatory domain-containing protein [Fulvivirgaceae bacterium BMA12]|uniref:Carboxypeptidase-like regulatory domain-containing protein n=1 Tax=Agaribacillus aureus TaxID=3051825 RepID=A0ABT8L2Z1_9BACT|nr:carboxypeptidase-like regulatory domain-containing protein [Fulvivirgaceae bacterium BMA12]